MKKLQGRAAAIGVFDGIHIGHKKILETLKSVAAYSSEEAIVLIVELAPSSQKKLTTREEKKYILEDMGFSEILFLDQGFERAHKGWKNWSPEDFIEVFLKDELSAVDIVIGEDFRFGKDRRGDVSLLKARESKDFRVHINSLEHKDGIKISSSYIRQLIIEGRIEYANKLLGRPYSFSGKSVKGRGMGTLLGFPTINIEVDKAKLLPEGVFETQVMLSGVEMPIKAACFIGLAYGNYDVPGKNSIEIHIPELKNEKKEIKILHTEILRKIRDTERFDHDKDLIDQISKDIEQIRRPAI